LIAEQIGISQRVKCSPLIRCDLVAPHRCLVVFAHRHDICIMNGFIRTRKVTKGVEIVSDWLCCRNPGEANRSDTKDVERNHGLARPARLNIATVCGATVLDREPHRCHRSNESSARTSTISVRCAACICWARKPFVRDSFGVFMCAIVVKCAKQQGRADRVCPAVVIGRGSWVHKGRLVAI